MTMYGDKDYYKNSDDYTSNVKNFAHQSNLLARYTYVLLYLDYVCPCVNIVVADN